MPSPFATVIDWLLKYDRILLIIHLNPDGDAIASALALSKALDKLGKQVGVVSRDIPAAPFSFLPGINNITRDFFQGDWDVLVTLDCGDLKRTGFVDRVKDFSKRKKRMINIDHHPKNDLHKIANINYFDTGVAATGELVAKVIDGLNVDIDRDMATCLLTAIYTDTGGFKHSNTSVKTLELASRLLSAGARLKKITSHISNSKTVQSLRLWGIVLSRIRRHKELSLVCSFVTRDDLIDCHATQEDLAGAVNLIGSVPGTKAAILLSEQGDGLIKASLRSEYDDVDVSKIAHIFGGGGHKKASGFVIPGRIFKDKGSWRIITN